MCPWAETPGYKYKSLIPSTVQSENDNARMWLESWESTVARVNPNWTSRNSFYVNNNIINGCDQGTWYTDNWNCGIPWLDY